MDNKFIILILKIVSKKFSGNELKVFCILLKHMDSKNVCYPSVRTIANNYGMSPTTVSKCIQTLEDKKVIVKQNRTVNGKNTSNLYRISDEFLIQKKKRGLRNILPDWFDKDIKSNNADKKDIEEMKNLLEEFK